MDKMENAQPENEGPILGSAKSNLERKLIEKYLADQGYSLADLERLPEEQAERIMAEASLYASLRLAKIEATADLWDEVEGKD